MTRYNCVMRSYSVFSLSLTLAVGLAVGCGKGKKNTKSEEASLVCESDDECEAGWVCLDGECANAASGAIYTDPANSVTPDKVKGQIEKIQENSQKRADEILEGL